MFRTWFKNLTTATTESRQQAAPRGTLSVEPLEGRDLMSVAAGLVTDVPQIERFVTPGEIRMTPAVQVATRADSGIGASAQAIDSFSRPGQEVEMWDFHRPADIGGYMWAPAAGEYSPVVKTAGAPDTRSVDNHDIRPVGVTEVGRDDPFFRSATLSQKV